MAPVVPPTRQDMIDWYTARIADWTSNAAVLGIEMQSISDLATSLDAATTAQSDAFAARIASRDATVVYHNEAATLRDIGAGIVKTIKATIETSGNNNLYAVASIPPPTPPSPLGPPATPTNVTAVLNNEGFVRVAWDGSRTGGTSFRVERATTPVGGTQGSWTLLSTVEERVFVDQAVPQGLATALYRVKAQRSGGTSGASEPGQVVFGTGGSSQQQTNLGLAA